MRIDTLRMKTGTKKDREGKFSRVLLNNSRENVLIAFKQIDMRAKRGAGGTIYVQCPTIAGLETPQPIQAKHGSWHGQEPVWKIQETLTTEGWKPTMASIWEAIRTISGKK